MWETTKKLRSANFPQEAIDVANNANKKELVHKTMANAKHTKELHGVIDGGIATSRKRSGLLGPLYQKQNAPFKKLRKRRK